LLDIGQHGKGKILEVFMVLAPGKMDVFGIRTATEQLRVAVLELSIQLAECGDLSRADKREVLRPEKNRLSIFRRSPYPLAF
jgi:hypothetical protein